MINNLTIERENSTSAPVIKGAGYTAHQHVSISPAELAGLLRLLTQDITYQESTSSSYNTLYRDIWQVFTNLPNKLEHISVYFTSTDDGESGDTYICPQSDPGFIGYINTNEAYTGSSATRGTINLGMSAFRAPMNATLVLEIPTWAMNDKPIKTIHLFRKPFGTSNNTFAGESWSNSNLPMHCVSPILGRNSKYSSFYSSGYARGEYKEFMWAANNLQNQTSASFWFASMHDGDGYNLTVDGLYDVVEINDQLYFKMTSMYTALTSFDDYSLKTVDLVKKDDLSGYNLKYGESYNPLKDATGFSTKYKYIEGIFQIDDKHLAVFSSDNYYSSSSVYHYYSVYDMEEKTWVLEPTTSFYTGRSARFCGFKRAPNGICVITMYYHNSTSSSAAFVFDKNKIVSGASSDEVSNFYTANSAYHRRDGLFYYYMTVNSVSGVSYHGFYERDKPLVSITLDEPIIKTEDESIRITLDLDFTLE